ncbi:transglycosylase SLT domain-containing protein [Burkholderia glumae]|uniref:transglycosylase SLT domain-containing protein n=1 Tax=Burkholderia glumae TaxID=337 RepID=UPI0002E84659|nr:transglycosylase SLT domain-containing protein [Burkholderia glumae]PJO22167.1 lytic transglycosylase [Burkholderia glumae AU6208]QHE12624.1 transglycosylase SLT domain-containing protein [Burkholderia glumae AU6208]
MRRVPCSIVLLLGCACAAPAAFAEAAVPAPAEAPSAGASAVPAPASLTQANAPARGPVSAYLIRKFGVAKRKAEQISDAVSLAAAKYSLPPAVLLAIISIESRFREKARGANGATGLMQVVPSAHRGLLRSVKDLTEPTANINAGSAILYGYMQAANGDLDIAMRRYGGSQAYAQKIRLRAEEFDKDLRPAGPATPDADADADSSEPRETAPRSRAK